MFGLGGAKSENVEKPLGFKDLFEVVERAKAFQECKQLAEKGSILLNIDEKEERYASPGRPATEANTREIRDRPTAVSGSQPNTDSQSGTDSDTEASVEPCGTEI